MQRWRDKQITVLLIGLLLLTITISGCSRISGNLKSGANEKPKNNAKIALASDFAPYREVAVNIKPSLPPYQVASDLANLTNRSRFDFSPQAQQLIVQNGFVVVPGNSPEFFMLYEPNRYDGLPNFITTDAMLHNYHIFFSFLLKNVEQKRLIPELQHLNAAMLAEASKQHSTLKGSTWGNAARRNLAFFAVASRLLDPQIAVPPPVAREVEQELTLINGHRGIETSPLMSMGRTPAEAQNLPEEDYSQYIPRGHYTKSEALKHYFQSMMWYGRMTFRLKDEDETRSAVLITLALNQADHLKSWDNIYEPTNYFVGKSDDLGYYQYMPLLQQVYGQDIDPGQLPSEQAKWKSFLRQAHKLTPPSINSIPIFDANKPPNRDQEIKGFRFMGQRFTLDASVFQRLVYRAVAENPQGQQRMLPKGLDIPAAMGSSEAYTILKSMGETGYSNYPENMHKLQDHIAGLKQDTWTQNLYWSWLYNLLPLTQEKPEGYPSFMRNQAWIHKELNTYLGSWTELKHDTILYAKQCYAECGGGPEDSDDRGYVEPNPQLYARLASLAAMTRDGLAARGLLDARDKTSLTRMQELSLSLKTISEKELNQTPLTAKDYELIRSFGGQLEHFWLEALRDELKQGRPNLYDNPGALVADVATDPNGEVLEEATGYVAEIYVAVPVDGKLRIAKGGVYSYYEFAQPLSQRLTDQQWWQMLKDNKTPPSPRWTAAFTTAQPEQVQVNVWGE